jgi:hypothetical protein
MLTRLLFENFRPPTEEDIFAFADSKKNIPQEFTDYWSEQSYFSVLLHYISSPRGTSLS